MANPSEKTRPGRKRIAAAIGLLLVIALAVTGYWFLYLRGVVSTDDSRIDGDLVDVAPQIGGLLDSLYVREGEQVKAGRVLFTLDTKALEATLSHSAAEEASSRSSLAVASAEYQKAVNGPLPTEIGIAEAEMKRAEAAVRLASMNRDRADTLHKNHAVTDADYDKAQTDWETLRQSFEGAKIRLKLLRDGTRREDIEAARANLDTRKADLLSSEAAVRQAQVNLDYAKVEAPFDGVVVRKWRDPGATLAPGTPVLTLLNPASLHVSANVEEKNLRGVEIGDRVDISLDAYPGMKLKGRVEKILRAANSRFSLIPSEGVSGTYIKVAQRITLRITLDSIPDIPLAPGLSTLVRIHSGTAPRRSASGVLR
jgi:membrane fusion protein, multidrug efflux system